MGKSDQSQSAEETKEMKETKTKRELHKEARNLQEKEKPNQWSSFQFNSYTGTYLQKQKRKIERWAHYFVLTPKVLGANRMNAFVEKLVEVTGIEYDQEGGVDFYLQWHNYYLKFIQDPKVKIAMESLAKINFEEHRRNFTTFFAKHRHLSSESKQALWWYFSNKDQANGGVSVLQNVDAKEVRFQDFNKCQQEQQQRKIINEQQLNMQVAEYAFTHRELTENQIQQVLAVLQTNNFGQLMEQKVGIEMMRNYDALQMSEQMSMAKTMSKQLVWKGCEGLQGNLKLNQLERLGLCLGNDYVMPENKEFAKQLMINAFKQHSTGQYALFQGNLLALVIHCNAFELWQKALCFVQTKNECQKLLVHLGIQFKLTKEMHQNGMNMYVIIEEHQNNSKILLTAQYINYMELDQKQSADVVKQYGEYSKVFQGVKKQTSALKVMELIGGKIQKGQNVMGLLDQTSTSSTQVIQKEVCSMAQGQFKDFLQQMKEGNDINIGIKQLESYKAALLTILKPTPNANATFQIFNYQVAIAGIIFKFLKKSNLNIVAMIPPGQGKSAIMVMLAVMLIQKFKTTIYIVVQQDLYQQLSHFVDSVELGKLVNSIQVIDQKYFQSKKLTSKVMKIKSTDFILIDELDWIHDQYPIYWNKDTKKLGCMLSLPCRFVGVTGTWSIRNKSKLNQLYVHSFQFKAHIEYIKGIKHIDLNFRACQTDNQVRDSVVSLCQMQQTIMPIIVFCQDDHVEFYVEELRLKMEEQIKDKILGLDIENDLSYIKGQERGIIVLGPMYARGFDVKFKEVAFVIVAGALFKVESQYIQALGRSVRGSSKQAQGIVVIRGSEEDLKEKLQQTSYNVQCRNMYKIFAIPRIVQRAAELLDRKGKLKVEGFYNFETEQEIEKLFSQSQQQELLEYFEELSDQEEVKTYEKIQMSDVDSSDIDPKLSKTSQIGSAKESLLDKYDPSADQASKQKLMMDENGKGYYVDDNVSKNSSIFEYDSNQSKDVSQDVKQKQPKKRNKRNKVNQNQKPKTKVYTIPEAQTHQETDIKNAEIPQQQVIEANNNDNDEILNQQPNENDNLHTDQLNQQEINQQVVNSKVIQEEQKKSEILTNDNNPSQQVKQVKKRTKSLKESLTSTTKQTKKRSRGQIEGDSQNTAKKNAEKKVKLNKDVESIDNTKSTDATKQQA